MARPLLPLRSIYSGSGGSGFSYSRSITVTSTTSIASGTLTNFPILVSSTVSSWKSSSNGGNIQNLVTAPNGGQEAADLVFATSTANCTAGNYLNFETESYTSSTGALIAWVNVPTMATGTVIYTCYDAAGVTTDQSHPSSTWNSNYLAVWHFPNGTILNASDSTSNGNNLINGTASAMNGLIDGAASFNGTSDQKYTANTTFATTTYTISAWVYTTSTGDISPWSVGEFNDSGNSATLLISNLQVGLGVNGNATGGFFIGSGLNISTGTWQFASYSRTGSLISFVVNGTVAEPAGSATAPSTGNPFQVGATSRNGNKGEGFWSGYFDEIELSKINLTTQWLLTEYNNQNSPSTFYTVGNETAL